MKIDIKKLPKSEVELTISIPYERVMKAEEDALIEIGKTLKIDGFRSGNIPEDVVRKHVDEASIKGKAFEMLLPEAYTEAVQKHDLQVIAQPKVDLKQPAKKEGDELIFVATVATMPDVKVGDYKKIKVKKPEVKVEKKQVDETIKMVMERYAEWEDVKRKAKKEDRAELTFEGFDSKGTALPNTNSKNHPVIIGSSTMIPGFEDAVIGMEVGDDKEFDVTFPKDYHAKDMQGMKVTFKINLGRLEARKEQKLDDAFVEKIMNQKQTVADFKKKVEEDLEGEMKGRAQNEHDSKVIEEVIKITKAELPEILIEEEVKYMKEQQKKRVEQQGLKWDQYLEHIKKSEEDFDKEHLKSAEERILARMGVQYIINDAKIKVEDKDIQERIASMKKSYPKDQQAQFEDHYKPGSNGYMNLQNQLSADKLIEMLTK